MYGMPNWYDQLRMMSGYGGAMSGAPPGQDTPQGGPQAGYMSPSDKGMNIGGAASDLAMLLASGGGMDGLMKQSPGMLMKLMGMGGGIPGMLAMSLLPAGISAFMGNPMEQRRREAMQAISPEAIQKATQENVKRIMNSQGFHMANRMAMMGGQGAMNQMSAGLAKNGMGHSGIGSVVPGLGSMAITQQRGGFNTQAELQGHDDATKEGYMKFQTLMGYAPPPSRTQSLLAGGFNAMGPFMGQALQRRYQPQQWGIS